MYCLYAVDGLGIYAATDLRTGDEIFQIPPGLIIRPEVGHKQSLKHLS